MKLATFYEKVAPVLEGEVPPTEGARALFGAAAATGKDGRHLAIYARFCRAHRFEAVDFVYEATRATVLRQGGLPLWERLVEAYFRAHPMHHVELNANGEALPGFLREQPEAPLPGWLPELAEFEWWEWQTQVAADASATADGPLRIAPAVELRPFQHDLVAWLASDRSGEPSRRECVVVFWRTPDLRLRRDIVTAAELGVLKAVFSEQTPSADTSETVEDLLAAGILVGQP